VARAIDDRVPAARRRRLLALAALGVCLDAALEQKGSTVSATLRAVAVAPALVLVAYAVFLVARRYERLPRALRRRPQLALHLGFWSLLACLWLLPSAAPVEGRPLALFAILLPALLWRLGYLLKSGQRGKAAGSAFTDHLFYLWPLWGGSETPYGKGLDNLARVEARTPAALARSQLAGLKLLLLALVWKGALFVMSGVVYGDAGNGLTRLLGGAVLGVPRLDDLVRRRAEVPLAIAWLGIYCDLVWSTLRIAAKGHVYVGLLRLFGFNAFRNTYKPLLSISVLEFWNRYYYYFKELLAEFFFYPTYARIKSPPWLRTLLATFAAAFVGNLYYHALQQDRALVAGDFAALGAAFPSRTLYCFLLAIGIFLSMTREQRRRGTSVAPLGRVARLRRIAGVWTFFALIHVWAHATPEPTLAERTSFFLSLFGL